MYGCLFCALRRYLQIVRDRSLQFHEPIHRSHPETHNGRVAVVNMTWQGMRVVGDQGSAILSTGHRFPAGAGNTHCFLVFLPLSHSLRVRMSSLWPPPEGEKGGGFGGDELLPFCE